MTILKFILQKFIRLGTTTSIGLHMHISYKFRLIIIVIVIVKYNYYKIEYVSKYFLLYIRLNCLVFYTTGKNITFTGFTEGKGYTYYTNGNNLITELTCSANGVSNSGVYNIRAYWFYNQDTNTGSNVLMFENVATEVKWKEGREYLCRAVYLKNGVEYQKDSNTITVYIERELINFLSTN